MGLQPVDGCRQTVLILQQRRDVVEEDAGFGEIRHLADQGLQIFHGTEGIVTAFFSIDAEHAGALDDRLFLFDTPNIRPSRAGVQPGCEFRELVRRAGRVNFHAAIIQIARIAREVQLLGGALSEITVTDTLYTPADEPAAGRHSPGGRRLCQSVRAWNSRPTASSVFSEKGSPTTCSATGTLSAKPQGSTSAGSPARFPA